MNLSKTLLPLSLLLTLSSLSSASQFQPISGGDYARAPDTLGELLHEIMAPRSGHFSINQAACNTCWFGFRAIDNIISIRDVLDRLEEIAVGICENGGFVANNTVCPPIVKMMGDILVPVLTQSIFHPDYFCSYTLRLCDTPKFDEFYADPFVQRVLSSKPASLQSNDYMNNLYKKASKKDTVRIVQISDPHLDFYYQEGTIKDCNMPVCCRADSGFTDDPARASGYWGDYMCDLPHNTLVNMLEFVRDEIKPDMFVWTGDNSAHNVWDNTESEIIQYTLNITMTIKEVLNRQAEHKVSVFPI